MGNKFQAKVYRSRDGLCITLPNSIVDMLKIEAGETLLVWPQGKQIVIEKPWVPPNWVCP